MFGVFLAFYLANDHFPGATPLQFAFVGGLSFSVGLCTPTILLIVKEAADMFASFYCISIRHNIIAQHRLTDDRHHWWAVYIVRSPSIFTILSDILTHKHLQRRLCCSIFLENHMGTHSQPRSLLRHRYGNLLYRNCRPNC